MIRHSTFETVGGEGMTVRQYVAAQAVRQGVRDELVLDDLELQWRSSVNRSLKGTGLGLVGEHFVGSETFTPEQVRAQMALEDRAERAGVQTSGYGAAGAAVQTTGLSDAQVAAAVSRGHHLALATGLSLRGLEAL